MMADTERWLPVPGWEGQYSVSDHGRVRSEARTVIDKNGKSRRVIQRILKPTPRVSGHLYLDFGRQKRGLSVHGLVLLAFVGPCPDGLERLHWDDNPENNFLSNLRYGTRSENLQDALRNGTHPTGSKTHCPRNHPYSPENTYIAPGNGGRNCRTCVRERSQELAAQRRAERPAPQPQMSCRRAGHDWSDPRNVYRHANGSRYCGECTRISAREKHQKRRAAQQFKAAS